MPTPTIYRRNEMGNMSYCKFQNTLDDLWDCVDDCDKNIYEECECPDEEMARKQLIKLCIKIAESQ